MAICTVGLGKTAIIEMKRIYRSQLPSRVKEAKLNCFALRNLLTADPNGQLILILNYGNPLIQSCEDRAGASRRLSSAGAHSSRVYTASRFVESMVICLSARQAKYVTAPQDISRVTGPGHPPPTIVHLSYSQLFGFLQQQARVADLQMICPLSGQPLPSIDLGLDASGGKQATVQFSLRASEALIEYIRISQAMK